MTKLGDKLKKSLEEALAYAKGNPAEGTRETWIDPQTNSARSRTFKNGKWEDNNAPRERLYY